MRVKLVILRGFSFRHRLSKPKNYKAMPLNYDFNNIGLKEDFINQKPKQCRKYNYANQCPFKWIFTFAI